jgi:hypothetical protein
MQVGLEVKVGVLDLEKTQFTRFNAIALMEVLVDDCGLHPYLLPQTHNSWVVEGFFA